MSSTEAPTNPSRGDGTPGVDAVAHAASPKTTNNTARLTPVFMIALPLAPLSLTTYRPEDAKSPHRALAQKAAGRYT